MIASEVTVVMLNLQHKKAYVQFRKKICLNVSTYCGETLTGSSYDICTF